MSDSSIPDRRRCASCGTELAPALLVCPSCHALVHAADLKRLAADAQRAADSGDASAALGAWREALALLPPATEQYRSIAARVAELSKQVESGAAGAKQRSRWAKGAAGAGGAGIVLSKLKLLLLGLTKASTLLSMLAFAGVYWAAWGWRFGVGIALSIYVHEMGHVAALRRYGIPATAPMFIPGLGALVRLKAYPMDPREDARIGLAGPIWGFGAAVAAYLLFLATGWGSLAAIAQLGAWINLFNLIPVWQLDGARGFHALDRRQRWIATGAIALTWIVTRENLLLLVGLVAAAMAVFGRAEEEGDSRAAIEYVGLIVALSALTRLPVPVAGP
ncbi:MAG TPA: site-2 protease family protein [Gemmatimonadales bacterium]|nr:site-2 protease family protein [Gemmatimonadales bacterium]